MEESNLTLHVLPLFGVNGCGKTRIAIELLSNQWAYYFNASSDDLGSDDMTSLLNIRDDWILSYRNASLTMYSRPSANEDILVYAHQISKHMDILFSWEGVVGGGCTAICNIH